jgi:hypothetical protein
MQFMRRLIVLLPITLGNIFVIPEVVNLRDSQGAEIAEELAAFDVHEADPVEFSATRLLVCCTVRFSSRWSGIPSRIRGDRLGSSIVLDRHVAVPRGLVRSPKRALRLEQSFAAGLIPRSGRFTDLGALQR